MCCVCKAGKAIHSWVLTTNEAFTPAALLERHHVVEAAHMLVKLETLLPLSRFASQRRFVLTLELLEIAARNRSVAMLKRANEEALRFWVDMSHGRWTQEREDDWKRVQRERAPRP